MRNIRKKSGVSTSLNVRNIFNSSKAIMAAYRNEISRKAASAHDARRLRRTIRLRGGSSAPVTGKMAVISGMLMLYNWRHVAINNRAQACMCCSRQRHRGRQRAVMAAWHGIFGGGGRRGAAGVTERTCLARGVAYAASVVIMLYRLNACLARKA